MPTIFENHFVCRPDCEEAHRYTPEALPGIMRKDGIVLAESCRIEGIPRICYTVERDSHNFEEDVRVQTLDVSDFEGRIRIGENVFMESTFNPAFHNQPVKLTLVKCNDGSPGTIEIGDNVYLAGLAIVAYEQVVIEKNALFGPMVTIMDSNGHPLLHRGREDDVARTHAHPVFIRENAWIGMGATILAGVEIGVNSVVSANSVVHESVPPNCIAVGNPAQIVKRF